MNYKMSIYTFSKWFLAVLLVLITTKSYADSGGKLSAAQAAYDVKYYNLNLVIDPSSKTINGYLLCRAEIVSGINILELDLDSVFTVDSILYQKNSSEFIPTTFSHTN